MTEEHNLERSVCGFCMFTKERSVCSFCMFTNFAKVLASLCSHAQLSVGFCLSSIIALSKVNPQTSWQEHVGVFVWVSGRTESLCQCTCVSSFCLLKVMLVE